MFAWQRGERGAIPGDDRSAWVDSGSTEGILKWLCSDCLRHVQGNFLQKS